MDSGQRDDVSASTLGKLLREEAKKEMELSLTYASSMEFQDASHHAGIALGLMKASDIMNALLMKERP